MSKLKSAIRIFLGILFLLSLSSRFTSPVFAQSKGFSLYHPIGMTNDKGGCPDADEFLGNEETPLHTVGNRAPYNDIRPWIGHRDCPDCTKKETKQRFKLTGLTPNHQYFFVIKPSYISPLAPYVAELPSDQGDVFMGGQWVSPIAGNIVDQPEVNKIRWVIGLTPKTSAVVLTIRSDSAVKSQYLCYDVMFFFSNPLNSIAQTNDRLKFLSQNYELKEEAANGLNQSSGGYNWRLGHRAHVHLWTYALTYDAYYLEKTINVLDQAISQRDIVTKTADYRGRYASAWQERKTKYVWVGFTGAVISNLTYFAYLVASRPELWQLKTPEGTTYREKAKEFVTAAEEAVDFHEREWKINGNQGYYVFESDQPSSPKIRGRIVAYNMNSLMHVALLYLYKYYDAIGNTAKASDYRKMVIAYATHFKSILQPKNNIYIWKYSDYYSGPDDMGHANFNVLFAYLAYKNSIVFTRADMERFANTLSQHLTAQYDCIHDLVDGSDSKKGDRCSLKYYWPLLAEFDEIIFSKFLGMYAKTLFNDSSFFCLSNVLISKRGNDRVP